MSYGRYGNQIKGSVGPQAPQRKIATLETAIPELLGFINNENWDHLASTHSLIKDYIMGTAVFGKKGDKLLLQLISHVNPDPTHWNETIWLNGKGQAFLRWMLMDQSLKGQFVTKPKPDDEGDDDISGKLPIHLAVEKKNHSFLTCFLGLCYQAKFSANDGVELQQLHQVLEQVDDVTEQSGVHCAMKNRLPFVAFMVAVCSAKALTDKDAEGYTPLHRALRMKSTAATSVPLKPTLKDEQREKAFNGKEIIDPAWDNTFNPRRIMEEIQHREDADDILPQILTTVSKTGNSPYQENLDKYDDINSNERQVQPFKLELKKIIFQKVRGISNVSKALYGNSGSVKELCLDMSDFNQSSHNFERFIEKLTTLDGNGGEGVDMGEDEATLQFEDTLFFVQLPDLNYVKQPCPHHSLQKLFFWLRDKKNVLTIKKLNIPDSTANPMNLAFFRLNILDHFIIEELDWRTLDINLDILTETVVQQNIRNGNTKSIPRTVKTSTYLKKLTLYSSGNWSVLYHWISKDGLATLPELKSVQIEIINLDTADGVHDQHTQACYLKMAKQYKSYLEIQHADNKKQYEKMPSLNFNYDLKVKIKAKWYYPPPPLEPEEPTVHIPKHQFTGQLGPCQKFFDELSRKRLERNHDNINGDDMDQYDSSGNNQSVQNMAEDNLHVHRFQDYALRGNLESNDNRIKVAIIDNGADRIRSIIGEMIAKGVSYVTADLFGTDQILPWWMVSDAHGTQMASLIGQTNPYCRLYIARVGKGRNDIDPRNAAKAIRWALDQNVDIISMSWTTKKRNKELEDLIKEASFGTLSKRPTLMFCSTADEGLYSEAVYPADFDQDVVRVSATDRWGHLTAMSQSAKPADIQIPGENIEAVGPAYIGSVLPTVSGSSVATALAAGIASLALLLLRTYNDLDEREIREIYSKAGILRVFKKMDADKGGIQLSKLFPRETKDDKSTSKIMAQNWNITNFQ